mmetsp:Transcript_39954/g.61130  ORF Transcript_39954/g.61130 Transcript_39954/m.61130 type:complete len:97 (+) Transcript_39954:762-1052(+)
MKKRQSNHRKKNLTTVANPEAPMDLAMLVAYKYSQKHAIFNPTTNYSCFGHHVKLGDSLHSRKASLRIDTASEEKTPLDEVLVKKYFLPGKLQVSP